MAHQSDDWRAILFRVRYERLTPGEKHFLRAMVELGPDPHRTGDIAEKLGLKVNAPTLSLTSFLQRSSVLVAA